MGENYFNDNIFPKLLSIFAEDRFTITYDAQDGYFNIKLNDQ